MLTGNVHAELGTMKGEHFEGRRLLAFGGIWMTRDLLGLCVGWIVCGWIVENVLANADPLS